MARGTDIHQTTAIGEIIAPDGTVNAITEEGTIDGNETTGETGQGEMAAGIAIAGTRTAEGVLPMPTSGDILPPNRLVVHPMVHHVREGHLIPIGKRASEHHSFQHVGRFVALTRIHKGYPLTHYADHPHPLGKCLLI